MSGSISGEGSATEEFWKGLQQHMGYTDEEIERFKKDPKKSKYAPLFASRNVQNKTLVIEVVDSHGCVEGMKPGDKLYFTGCGNLDTKRSSNWCSGALTTIANFTCVVHNLLLHGIDPNDMYADHFPCIDCGTKYGWGQVVMKAYVIDEAK